MKVKTLIKNLNKYDPDMNVEIMVAAKDAKTRDYSYLFAYTLKVKKDNALKDFLFKKCVLIYGELEKVLQE